MSVTMSESWFWPRRVPCTEKVLTVALAAAWSIPRCAAFRACWQINGSRRARFVPVRLIRWPLRKRCATSPASVYAATKLAQEDLLRVVGNALGIPFLIFRLQNVYGEGQSLNNPYTGILSIFSNRIRQGKEIVLFEDGQESRDFVHVSDVAEAMALGLESDNGDGLTMNVGSGAQVSVETIARNLHEPIQGFECARGGFRSISFGRYPPQLRRHYRDPAAFGVCTQSVAGGRHRALCRLGQGPANGAKRR